MGRTKQGYAHSEEVYTVTITRDVVTGVAIIEDWEQDGKGHREDGPAHISRNRATGIVTHEGWMRKGLLHREDGPANIMRKADTGRVFYSAWYRNGEKIPAPKPSTPSRNAALSPRRRPSEGPTG